MAKPSVEAIALSPAAAAARIGLSVATLNRLVRAGRLTRTKVGARTLIRVSELDALLGHAPQVRAA